MEGDDTKRRVLVIGRSRTVLDGAVEELAARGCAAQATSDFEAITDQVDPQALDVVVLGGQIPPATKTALREQLSAANDAIVFVQGLSGIPGLIADQVQGVLAGEQLLPGQAPEYDAARRAIALSLFAALDVKVTVYWITALIPPDPASDSLVLHDGPLAPGDHAFEIPDTVSLDAAFATVTAAAAIWSFRLA